MTVHLFVPLYFTKGLYQPKCIAFHGISIQIFGTYTISSSSTFTPHCSYEPPTSHLLHLYPYLLHVNSSIINESTPNYQK